MPAGHDTSTEKQEFDQAAAADTYSGVWPDTLHREEVAGASTEGVMDVLRTAEYVLLIDFNTPVPRITPRSLCMPLLARSRLNACVLHAPHCRRSGGALKLRVLVSCG